LICGTKHLIRVVKHVNRIRGACVCHWGRQGESDGVTWSVLMSGTKHGQSVLSVEPCVCMCVCVCVCVLDIMSLPHVRC